MWMLTSVLSPKSLSRKRIAELYRLRWGIEVEFRGLKQTMDRGEWRCRNSKRVLAELNWSIMAMAVAELSPHFRNVTGSPTLEMSHCPRRGRLAQRR